MFKFSSLFLISLLLMGSGCIFRPETERHTEPPSAGTASSSQAEEPNLEYSTTFDRGAAPTWISASIDDFKLSIPYAREWQVNGIGLSEYDIETVSLSSRPVEQHIIRFGRPINGGTYIIREYYLYQTPTTSLAELQQKLTPGCGDEPTAKLLQINGSEGVQHTVGGAKGCSVGFAFTTPQHTYFIYRIADFGNPTPTIHEEMKKVIESIKE